MQSQKGKGKFMPSVLPVTWIQEQTSTISVKHGRFSLNAFILWRWLSTVHWDCGIFILGDSWKPSRNGSEQSAVGNPSWARLLDQKTQRGPFQPQPFVVLWPCESHDSSEKPNNYLSLGGDQKIKWLKMRPIFWGFWAHSPVDTFFLHRNKNKVSNVAFHYLKLKDGVKKE